MSFTRHAKTATRVLSVLALGFAPLLCAQDRPINQEELLRRLRQIEERLDQLERQTARPAAPTSQPAPPAQDASAAGQIQELRRQVDILAEEIEKLRSADQPASPLPAEEAMALGVGPAAASVYERRQQGVSIAGYGELLYENAAERDQSGVAVPGLSRLDILRAVFYAGYRFNDKFVFNSEVEIEHGNETFVEFAYLDYQARKELTLRGGLLLIPMGLVNEFHEPTVFLGARRPETETRIIPTTWRENGAGILGSLGPFDYRAYVVNGMDASGFRGEGLRGGRQRGIQAKASDFGVVGRLDWNPLAGVQIGGSYYSGESDQDQLVLDGNRLSVDTNIGEAHATFRRSGLDLRFLYAEARVGDTAQLNQALGLSGADLVGERLYGGYAQAGYNLFSRVSDTYSLAPFYRFERLHTQDDLAPGLVGQPAFLRSFHTTGLAFKPIPEIVIKGDYQWARNQARTGVNIFNLVLGYAF